MKCLRRFLKIKDLVHLQRKTAQVMEDKRSDQSGAEYTTGGGIAIQLVDADAQRRIIEVQIFHCTSPHFPDLVGDLQEIVAMLTIERRGDTFENAVAVFQICGREHDDVLRGAVSADNIAAAQMTPEDRE